MQMSDKLQFVVQVRQAKACRTSKLTHHLQFMRLAILRSLLAGSLLLTVLIAGSSAQRQRNGNSSPTISTNLLLRIIRAEDERRWDHQLQVFLSDKDANIRKRAALATGRIGDGRAIPALVELLQKDSDNDMRQMAAFGLGEIESPAGGDVLLDMLGYRTARGNERVNPESDASGAVARPRGPQPGSPAGVGRAPATSAVRARAVEALGKIAAALPDSENDRKRTYGEAILNALRFENDRHSQPDREMILLGLTAVLRARPDNAGPVVVRFLRYADSRIVADALNTLARLRLKDGNDDARRLLVNHNDPIVRANAARVLGATEDKQSFDALLDRALHDNDLRVRVSAIRALGSLKDARAGEPLINRAQELFRRHYGTLKNGFSRIGQPLENNELLEVAALLGRILPNTTNERALSWLREFRGALQRIAPEVEIAFARIAPVIYLRETELNASVVPTNQGQFGPNWRQYSSIAQGLASLSEIHGAANMSAGDQVQKDTQYDLRRMLDETHMPISALPDVLQALATFKPSDFGELARKHLKHSDVIVRSTAAELIVGLQRDGTNVHALIDALESELPLTEKGEMNDAALAILNALAKQKNPEANEAIKTALDSSDHLIRRKAVALLRANGAGDFSNRIGTVQTRNTEADYRRAITRIGKQVSATVVTSKGSFVIEFLPEDAPLTVDNFMQLAKKGFFNGQTIPRVVPNFVIQAGDPRGDTNGGPGYQIRCEINEVPYERGTVGMALSGKDTGGSQWFVTHSPQPHLDGGYTVFGHVVRGMEVVDNIARGDIIRRVIINNR